MYQKLGEHHILESSLTFSDAEKKTIQTELMENRRLPDFGRDIASVSYLDGCKVTFSDDSFVVCRFSGTEPCCACTPRRPQGVGGAYLDSFRRLIDALRSPLIDNPGGACYNSIISRSHWIDKVHTNKEKPMKKIGAILLTLLMLRLPPPPWRGNLVVYSPHDADPLQAGIALFQKAYPDIKVEYIAAGTGSCSSAWPRRAKTLWRMSFGAAARTPWPRSSLFPAYVSANDDVIGKAFKDAGDRIVGESPLPMVLFYNKTLVNEDEAPKTWEDLLNPKWKGKIALHPGQSGSAYTQLYTMILAQGGPEAAVGTLWRSSTRTWTARCRTAPATATSWWPPASTPLASPLKNPPCCMRITRMWPLSTRCRNSAVPNGVAIIKNCPNLENAKLFVDFVTGLECQKEQNENWERRPVRGDLDPVGLAPLSEIDLTDYDFDWAAKEKETIIEKWQEIIVNN